MALGTGECGFATHFNEKEESLPLLTSSQQEPKFTPAFATASKPIRGAKARYAIRRI